MKQKNCDSVQTCIICAEKAQQTIAGHSVPVPECICNLKFLTCPLKKKKKKKRENVEKESSCPQPDGDDKMS